MLVIERLLIHLIPLCIEILLGETSAECVLASLILFQIASIGLICGVLLSKPPGDCVLHQLLALLSFWFLGCLTVLLWILGRVLLHQYGGI
jgi:hypothetical protein